MCWGDPRCDASFCSRSPELGRMVCEPKRRVTALKPAFELGFAFRTKAAKSGGLERNRHRRVIASQRGAEPVNRSAAKTMGNLPLSAAAGLRETVVGKGNGVPYGRHIA